VAAGSTGSAVGSSSVLAEKWNGSSWAVLPAPNVAGAPVNAFSDVACASDTACVAVGGSGPGIVGAGNALAESWNGTAWTIQSTPQPSGTTQSEFFAVDCVSATACLAVGQYSLLKAVGGPVALGLADQLS
jgi:hypothetical protein